MQIELLKIEIAETQAQMKRAGKDREKESKEFQVTIADQRASVVSPSKALAKIIKSKCATCGHEHVDVSYDFKSLRLYVVPSSFIFASEAGDC